MGCPVKRRFELSRNSLSNIYETYRDVRRLNPDDHTEIDPIAEIKMMRPDVQIIELEES